MADRFKELFKEHYTRLQQQGLDLSTATAEALKAAHRDLLTPVPVALVAASPPPQPSPPPRHLARELTVAYVRELLDECRSNSSFTSLIRAVGSFFSDVDALLASFDGGSGTEGSMEVVPSDLDAGAAIAAAPAVSSSSDMNVVDTVVPSRECISIDIESVQHVYQLLLSCGSEGVVNALLHALDSLGSQLQMLSSVHVHSSPKSQMKLYLVVLEQPELLDPKYSHFLCSLLLSLEKTPVAGKMMLVNWIKERAGLNRFRRQIAMFQQFLTMQVLQGQINQATRAAAKILGFYYAARDVYPEILDGEFYNDALNGEYLRDENCSRQEFQLWIRDLKGSRRRGGSYVDEGWNNTTDGNLERLLASVEVSTSFVSFPYVLSPASKAKILEIDAMTQMNQRYQEERREASQRGETTFVPFFVLCVRRAHLMQDSLVTLVHGIGRDEDLKRPLKVMFDAEEGVDAGGVRKEYFQLILNKQHFLNPSYGMFVEHPESHLLWFNAHSFENQENFELIGTLLGIAIYNSVLVDLPMPAALYKKLKGCPCDLGDLAQLQPDLARSLQSVLSYDGDVASTFQMTFSISFSDIFGGVHSKDLKPDGASVLVTSDNRQEFVDLYVYFIFNESVEMQFSAFCKGFMKVCAGQALSLFTPVELEFLLCGNPVLDFEELEEGTQYHDGYERNSPSIEYFWQVLQEFDENEKKNFLKFATGSDRAPIDGLSQLGLVISKNTDDDDRLPSAHTCFNHLLLPAYSSAAVLKAKLKYAMEMGEGFQLR